MNAAELQKALGITPATLRTWINAGLPCKGKGRVRVFEPAAVEQWLLDTGRAEKPAAPSPAGVVARTMAEAAQLLDVSKRVFADWTKEPGFPGKPGTTGKRDGYFPIAEIQAWRVVRFGADARSGSDDSDREVRKDILEIKRDRDLAEFEQFLGTLVDAEQMALFICSRVATAKGVLQELPDRLLARLPSKMSPKLRKQIRKETLEVVREALEHLSELMKGDEDSKEDSE